MRDLDVQISRPIILQYQPSVNQHIDKYLFRLRENTSEITGNVVLNVVLNYTKLVEKRVTIYTEMENTLQATTSSPTTCTGTYQLDNFYYCNYGPLKFLQKHTRLIVCSLVSYCCVHLANLLYH